MTLLSEPLIRVGADFEEEYPGADALATECFANLVRTGDMLIGLHDRQAWDEHRLSSTARMVLAVIEGAGEPLEPGVIASRLILTSGSMTSLLDTLEKRGLVRRLPHPDDRRKLLVDVTDEAKAILDALLPVLHARARRRLLRPEPAGAAPVAPHAGPPAAVGSTGGRCACARRPAPRQASSAAEPALGAC